MGGDEETTLGKDLNGVRNGGERISVRRLFLLRDPQVQRP